MAILPEDDSFKRFSFYFISKESFFREGPTLLEFLMKGDTQFWETVEVFECRPPFPGHALTKTNLGTHCKMHLQKKYYQANA